MKHSKTAKSVPARRKRCSRRRTIESRRIPYKRPLYWKWMWSIIRRPGERRIERAMAWADRLLASRDVLT